MHIFKHKQTHTVDPNTEAVVTHISFKLPQRPRMSPRSNLNRPLPLYGFPPPKPINPFPLILSLSLVSDWSNDATSPSHQDSVSASFIPLLSLTIVIILFLPPLSFFFHPCSLCRFALFPPLSCPPPPPYPLPFLYSAT